MQIRGFTIKTTDAGLIELATMADAGPTISFVLDPRKARELGDKLVEASDRIRDGGKKMMRYKRLGQILVPV